MRKSFPRFAMKKGNFVCLSSCLTYRWTQCFNESWFVWVPLTFSTFLDFEEFLGSQLKLSDSLIVDENFHHATIYQCEFFCLLLIHNEIE